MISEQEDQEADCSASAVSRWMASARRGRAERHAQPDLRLPRPIGSSPSMVGCRFSRVMALNVYRHSFVNRMVWLSPSSGHSM
jgi:hypothetical protein